MLCAVRIAAPAAASIGDSRPTCSFHFDTTACRPARLALAKRENVGTAVRLVAPVASLVRYQSYPIQVLMATVGRAVTIMTLVPSHRWLCRGIAAGANR